MAMMSARLPAVAPVGFMYTKRRQDPIIRNEGEMQMGRKTILGTMLCGAVATALLTAPASAAQDRVSATEKGSLLIFSKVEIRWDGEGNVIQDTFIQLTNDYPEDVTVQMYFINGDPPLPPQGEERPHPGWNNVDNQIELTSNQPTYWSALTGSGRVSPFQVLDPGFPPGRPDPEADGQRMLRGYILAWAVDSISGVEIRWNHLAGLGTLVNYQLGAAYEYNTWAFQVVDDRLNGEADTDSPNVLNLDGMEYAQSFSQLLLQFQAVGSAAFSGPRLVVSNTDVTLFPVSVDLRQETEGPVITKAHYDVWNMNEVKLSGAYRCVTCWDQAFLSSYGIPNHFFLQTLQTDHGKARIDGLASQLCPGSVDAAILGIAAKVMVFDGGEADFAAAGSNLVGLGVEDAVIRYDDMPPPPENPKADDPIRMIENLLHAGSN
jgi:hypothetical protein